jgi:hypothetical protein
MTELRNLAASELKSTVLRLKLDLSVSMVELTELERILSVLRGTDAISPRTGAFVCERSALRISVSDWSVENTDLPSTITATVDRLKQEADTHHIAERGLVILYRLLQEYEAMRLD